MPRDFYWKSYKRCFSERLDGKVVAHHAELTIGDPMFLVSSRGRDRVRRTKQKEIHAVIRGDPVVSDLPCAVPVVYNPYMHNLFHRLDTDKPVHMAPVA